MSESDSDTPAPQASRRSHARLCEVACLFLWVGATGFGGPISVLAMIHGEVVTKKKWFAADEYNEAMALGQMLPGPVAVNTVTCLGYQLRGWLGAVLSATSFILPSFLLMLVLSLLYLHYGQTPQLAGVFRGLGAAVAAVILAAGWRMGRPMFNDLRSAALMVAAMIATALGANIVFLVLLSGTIGILFFRGANLPTTDRGEKDCR